MTSSKKEKLLKLKKEIEFVIGQNNVIGIDFIAVGNDKSRFNDHLLHPDPKKYLDKFTKDFFKRNPSLLFSEDEFKSVHVRSTSNRLDEELQYFRKRVPIKNPIEFDRNKEDDYWHQWIEVIQSLYPSCKYLLFAKYEFQDLDQITALFIYLQEDLSVIIKNARETFERILKLFLLTDATEFLIPAQIQEIKNQAIRAAISQVMARNMSHNIGSHVLNNISDGTELNKPERQIVVSNAYHPNTDFACFDVNQAELHLIYQLAIFNNYVKRRMDYLSDITFGTPLMQTSKKVFNELYKDFDKVRLLLEFISGLSNNFPYQIRFIVEPFDENFSVAMPNDILGCQAFYNIIENIIRNTAKHNQAKKRTTERTELTTFTIKFQEIPDECGKVKERSLFYQVEVYDDVPIPFETITTLVKSQNEKINYSVINPETNQLRTSCLGLLEMEASAAYLRKSDIIQIEKNKRQKIRYDNSIHTNGKLNFLKAFAKRSEEKSEWYLGYRFFVCKPLEYLFIGDFAISDERKKELELGGILLVTEDQFTKMLSRDVSFSHQFLFYVSNSRLCKIFRNDQKRSLLPKRIVELTKSSLLIEKLLSSAKFEDIEIVVWEIWFKKLKNGIKHVNVFSTDYDVEFDNGYNIAFTKHDDDWDRLKPYYAQGKINYLEALSSSALNRLPEADPDKSTASRYTALISETTKYKLFEAAISKVLVVDERIQRFSKKTYLNVENLEIYKCTNVTLPEIDLDKDNYDETIVNQIILFIKTNLPSSQFLLIHYSILERMYKSSKRKIGAALIQWSKSNATIVVTSGRGKPQDLPKEVCYVNLSPVLNVFTENRSKYSINYLLNSARR